MIVKTNFPSKVLDDCLVVTNFSRYTDFLFTSQTHVRLTVHSYYTNK